MSSNSLFALDMILLGRLEAYPTEKSGIVREPYRSGWFDGTENNLKQLLRLTKDVSQFVPKSTWSQGLPKQGLVHKETRTPRACHAVLVSILASLLRTRDTLAAVGYSHKPMAHYSTACLRSDPRRRLCYARRWSFS